MIHNIPNTIKNHNNRNTTAPIKDNIVGGGIFEDSDR